jgi:hypothetical protein
VHLLWERALAIDSQQATEIAHAAVQQRFGTRFGVTPLEGTPSPFYALEKIDLQNWRFFWVTDPDQRHVGGSQCLAIHRESGRVVFLGIVGE